MKLVCLGTLHVGRVDEAAAARAAPSKGMARGEGGRGAEEKGEERNVEKETDRERERKRERVGREEAHLVNVLIVVRVQLLDGHVVALHAVLEILPLIIAVLLAFISLRQGKGLGVTPVVLLPLLLLLLLLLHIFYYY
jgi:hypothetical protein